MGPGLPIVNGVAAGFDDRGDAENKREENRLRMIMPFRELFVGVATDVLKSRNITWLAGRAERTAGNVHYTMLISERTPTWSRPGTGSPRSPDAIARCAHDRSVRSIIHSDPSGSGLDESFWGHTAATCVFRTHLHSNLGSTSPSVGPFEPMSTLIHHSQSA